MSKLNDEPKNKFECKTKELLSIISNYIDECKSPYTKIIIRFMIGIVALSLILLLSFIVYKALLHTLYLLLIVVISKGIYHFGKCICELGNNNEQQK